MSEVTDLIGVYVKVGDKIAYAATDGRSSGLRVGTVTEIVDAHQRFDSWDTDKEYPRDVPTKVRVEVEASSGYGLPSKLVLIDSSFKRFVRLA